MAFSLPRAHHRLRGKPCIWKDVCHKKYIAHATYGRGDRADRIISRSSIHAEFGVRRRQRMQIGGRYAFRAWRRSWVSDVVVRQTAHGRFVTRAERTSSSVRFRFPLDGRRMARASLRPVPPDIKACFPQAREMSHAKAARKLVCYVVDEPRRDDAPHGKCFALACCNVGGVGVCGTGTASF